MTAVHRCAWALRSPEETLYHDTEWGVPLHDDVKLFEYLVPVSYTHLTLPTN